MVRITRRIRKAKGHIYDGPLWELTGQFYERNEDRKEMAKNKRVVPKYEEIVCAHEWSDWVNESCGCVRRKCLECNGLEYNAENCTLITANEDDKHQSMFVEVYDNAL